MSLQSEIIQKFQLNPTHAQHCERCFDETSALNFWIWDPNEAPDMPYLEADAPTKNHAYLLLTPTSRQRRESLEIKCEQVKERTFTALDKCLIADGSKCDGLLVEGRLQASLVVWIELKMNVKQKDFKLETLKNTIVGKDDSDRSAVGQILSARKIFQEKGINLLSASDLDRGFVAIPKKLAEAGNVSQEIQARIRKIQKTQQITIRYGPVLEI